MNRRMASLAGLIALAALLLAACAGPAALPVGRDLDGVPTAAPTAAGDGTGNDSNGEQIPGQPLLIVYNGSLDLEVADINATVSQAEALIKGMGGHVASSRASDTGTAKSAYVTYRIPAERWSDALAGLKGLATRVVNEDTSSEDVTSQVVDLDARLANLRATEAALQAIMDRATTITDVLKVQAELTSVRGDIESLTAQRDLLANRAALATLEVGFNTPPVAEVSQASSSWNLGSEVDSALAALVRLGQGALTLLLWLVIVVVPLFVPIVIVIWLANRLLLRWRRSHPAPAIASSGAMGMGGLMGGPLGPAGPMGPTDPNAPTDD